MNKKTPPTQRLFLVLMGAVTMGVMWRTRGETGWGSSWGVMAAGLVFALFIYYAIGRKRNASFFHIGIAAVSMMLTTPAWRPLLFQISGKIESMLTDATSPCAPASGIFMMLCLGFGTPVFFSFFISRLFSDRKYKWFQYLIVIAVPVAVYYASAASVSHIIVGVVQPEIKQAVAAGIANADIGGTPYSVYLQHFRDIAWANKHLEYGRTYFSEIATVSRAVASLAAYVTVRFAFKDKTGGRITLLGCLSMAFSITASDLFFVAAEKYPNAAWRGDAWSFWEYFTGFIFGALFTVVLLYFNERTEDTAQRELYFTKMPVIADDIFHAAFTFVFSFCLSVFRPVAERFEANDKMKTLTYIVGISVSVILAVLMMLKKLNKMWKTDAVKYAYIVFPAYFGVQMIIYLFSGDSECVRNIYEWGALLNLMLISYAVFYILYLLTYKQRKQGIVTALHSEAH